MNITWWHWLVLGLLLITLEMAASGGFYVIFFGIAALIVGVLALFGLAGPLWLQLLMFSVLSIAALMLFRRPLMRWMNIDGATSEVDTLVGELAVPLDDMPPGGVGRAELRGTVWTARNRAAVMVARGQRCTVVSVDRLTILIEPEGVRA
jgi:membrane protein implicated in regulation of membrane protease activity